MARKSLSNQFTTTRKKYETPALQVCLMEVVALFPVSQTEGENNTMTIGGKGDDNDVARGRRYSIWEKEDEEQEYE